MSGGCRPGPSHGAHPRGSTAQGAPRMTKAAPTSPKRPPKSPRDVLERPKMASEDVYGVEVQ
eukprot:2103026-Pyramimonas_sp.AAC.1